MFGDVRHKLEYTIRKKRNWMEEQSKDISLVILQSQNGICFTVLPITQELLNLEMHDSLKMVKPVGVMLHEMWRVRKLEYNDEEQQINDHEVNNELVVEQPQEIKLRRSQREKRSAISNDYVVYLQESENDLSIDNDPISFSEAINDDNSDKWLDSMKDELKSMTQNDV